MTLREIQERLAAAGAQPDDVVEHLDVAIGQDELRVDRYEVAFDGYGPAWHLLISGRSRPRDPAKPKGGLCPS